MGASGKRGSTGSVMFLSGRQTVRDDFQLSSVVV